MAMGTMIDAGASASQGLRIRERRQPLSVRQQTAVTVEQPAVAARSIPVRQGHSQDRQLTLLDLIDAVSSATDDDREVIATVVHMLRSGSATLSGRLREVPWEGPERGEV